MPSCIQNNRINIVSKTIAHIEQAIQEIVTEQKIAASIAKKTKQQLKNEAAKHTIDNWTALKNAIKDTLAPIISSNEFTKTINHATDFQADSIINKQISYNNITYNSQSYPIEQKALIEQTNAAFARDFSTSDKTAELLFNIYYLQATQELGYKLLVEKLILKKNELLTELTALKNSN